MTVCTGVVAAAVVVLVIGLAVIAAVVHAATAEQPQLTCGLDDPDTSDASDEEGEGGSVEISDRLTLSSTQVDNARLILGVAGEALATTDSATEAVMRSLARSQLLNLEESDGLMALDPLGYPSVKTLDKAAAIAAYLDNPPELNDEDEQWRPEAEAIVNTWATSLANPTTCTPTAEGDTSGTVGPGDTVSVQGIRVHISIAADLERLLTAARADGIRLAGWGYRDHATQIRLRREHCGTSDYAIYQMPSSECRPPTARPGRSMHEQGKAIDFTYNGRTIGSRRSPAFRWLAANAARYGLINLPSEPWHWSTNGR